ncbi:hypothetical protein [Aeromicrobium fastidiosum]|uniref:Uncharacterized protein n=1 Tax=Aeromicrobium fastidiosum TaxID=52699 RepID=A0A641ARP5_9ACTN|nr:hypothetical protein [Aeromicrobium fastidiosum]KAA1380615.1 hypothetical protein ESP62_005425 [Aeromicrobium fastidiosum]MBP2390217.1 hypothetical protein [Aeromicrobium fastidiosum]
MLVGSAVSFTTTYRGDRVKYRREEDSRWRDQRRRAYTDLAIELKSLMALLYRVAAWHGLDQQPDPLAPDQAVLLFAGVFQRRDVAFEPMLVVGDPSLIAAARVWAGEVNDTRKQLDRDAQHLTADTWDALVAEINVARQSFHDAARHDLRLRYPVEMCRPHCRDLGGRLA